MRNLLVAFLSFVAFSAIAQDEMATGKITNPRREPVSFATITVKEQRPQPLQMRMAPSG
jgi:hypothetical protein